MKKDISILLILLIGFFLGWFAMLFTDIWLGYKHSDNYWNEQIIEHNCGQYNPQTGKFEWLAGGHDG